MSVLDFPFFNDESNESCQLMKLGIHDSSPRFSEIQEPNGTNISAFLSIFPANRTRF